MEALRQQFFNLAIMERALPLLLMGLRQTALKRSHDAFTA